MPLIRRDRALGVRWVSGLVTLGMRELTVMGGHTVWRTIKIFLFKPTLTFEPNSTECCKRNSGSN